MSLGLIVCGTPLFSVTYTYTLLNRNGWTATASNESSDSFIKAQASIDSDTGSRYLSQTNQYVGMWVEFNFNALISIAQIEIQWSGNHWARGFRLLPSVDGVNYNTQIFSGSGINPSVIPTQKIQFSPIEVRKIKLEITQSFGDWLSFFEFQAYKAV